MLQHFIWVYCCDINASPCNSWKVWKKYWWCKCNGKVCLEYTPVEQKQDKEHKNDQWRLPGVVVKVDSMLLSKL